MVDEIDPDELVVLLGEGDSEDGLRVVDIRDTRAFDRGHLPGSESIPFPELTTRVPELEGAERIVTVCPHGIASRQAAQLIGSYEGTTDARVESLRGGIEAWERDVGDLVTTESEENAESEGDLSGSNVESEGPDAPF
ncbi:rhodanese-related sulfurtransferase [Halorubrum alkaliphilum]|uniref:Rhodanese-related sulfurtransferase n=1 Tax=Halorubrum alkaliphilum TaxID=261290 RepID=A0A8T4G9H5_9EURY|nr:rhodanese-like domain-containing protein [Halorubrum alkaliphilum]MBP1921064.1 rhodanese-related sulfurtransferase [Halorubrum alkaliphilum]